MQELNFLDLIILKKIDESSAVERFGTLINTSFFETANLLGTLKVKQLIEIESSIGGVSPVTLTEIGKGVLLEAEERAGAELDALDNAILSALAKGISELAALTASLNVRSNDLAYHLNKLILQHYADFTVRSAKVYISLTEKGFNHIGGVKGVVESDIGAAANEVSGLHEPASASAPSAASSPSSAGPKEAAQGTQQKLGEPAPAAFEPPLPVDVKRRLSKLEFYIKKYLPFAALCLVIFLAAAAYLILKAFKVI